MQAVMRAVSSISFSVQILTLTLWLMGKSLSVSVTGSVGSNISVSCRYPGIYANNTKFFCRMSGSGGPECVHTTAGETSSGRGRLSLRDAPDALQLTARISSLSRADSGRYCCGADISLRPDFTSDIWVTVTETHQPTDRVPEETGESYWRFMMMVALMCVCALFFVCVFGLFQVLKHKRRRNSRSVLHQTTSNPAPVEIQRTNLPDLPKVQSEKEEFYRPTSPDYKDTEADYMDVSSAQTRDQIYTELENNRQSRVYQSLSADSVQESIYHSIEQKSD